MSDTVRAAPFASRDPAADHPALRVLADVASYLETGIGTEDVFHGIAGALARGLAAQDCRVWVRSSDGSSFRPIAASHAAEPEAGRADRVAEWVAAGATQEASDGFWQVRFPLEHEGDHLGLLEARVPEGPAAAMARSVVGIVARILSPLLWSVELSADLASEVALRTREIDSQRRFTAKIIDSLPVGLYVIDRQYVIQAWNRKRETGTHEMNRDETLGRSVFEVMSRQPRELIKSEFDSVFATGRMEQVEVESGASGQPRFYRITKIPMRLNEDVVTHVITIGEDITEWKGIQKQIAQTEKMAAVGQLAAGVMHEINNPLATIGACVEALELRRGEIPREVRRAFDEYLGIIESELERCKAIVDGLLDFSRPKASLKKPVPVNQLVEDALFLVRHADRFKHIKVDRQLAESLPEIEANAKQLLQVFLDLMLNAIDAMDGEGTLTVRSRPSPQRRDEIIVAIGDTGHGIAREDIPKIFEPFFTTKPPGRGTGLGLSICYGIVAEHHGRITVDSQPN
ncbi:MAG: PAS domain-containing protein, partial [Gemmatimonadetes bacterium]|nr:PAS domain-containing protein [Gemmatimonadota bacterium]